MPFRGPFLPGAKKGTHESPWDTGGGYLRLAAGVSALAGLDAVLILEVAFQHLLALILTYGSPF